MLHKIIISLMLLISLMYSNEQKNPIAVIETTQGNIELELYEKNAPKSVENFITHIKNGYYNNTQFHRIIKNFMIQGGDPTATGRGGESIWKVKFEDEFTPGLVFDSAGILAMANSGPNTNGSQFFITTAPTMWLNGHHTIFGRVVSGMDTIKKLNTVETIGRRGGDRPIIKQEIIKASIKK
jgi:peptidylprolyl isomerase